VIRDRAAYERLRVAEALRALRALDMASSIAKLPRSCRLPEELGDSVSHDRRNRGRRGRGNPASLVMSMSSAILASLPFEDDARARVRKHRLFGRLVPLPTPEDLILFKVLAGRDKDRRGRRRTAASPQARSRYLHEALKAVCELAEDLEPQRRLDEVLRKASRHPGGR